MIRSLFDFVYDRNIRHRHTDRSFHPRTNDTVVSGPVYGRNIGHSNTNRHCIKIDPYAAVLLRHSALCYNVSINTGLYNVKIQSYTDLFYWSDGLCFCAQCYGRIQNHTVCTGFVRLSWRTRCIPNMYSSKHMMDYAN